MHRIEVLRRGNSDSDSDCVGLMVNRAMSASPRGRQNKWIVDFGATCPLCHDQ